MTEKRKKNGSKRLTIERRKNGNFRGAENRQKKTVLTNDKKTVPSFKFKFDVTSLKKPDLKNIDIKALLKRPKTIIAIIAVVIITGSVCVHGILVKNRETSVTDEADKTEEVSSEKTTPTVTEEKVSYEGAVDNELIENAEKDKEVTSEAILAYVKDGGYGYLNNCAFLGDSRTVGMVNYKYISDEDALAKVGVAHTDVERITFSQNSGKTYTVKQFLESDDSDVVYVCYGVNGMDSIPEDKYKESYTTLVDDIISWAPDSNIVLMAIWPVDDDGTYKGKVKNEWIDKYNAFLLSLAEEKGIYYLDVDTVLKDENGSIKEEFDGGDGLHYRSDAYKVIIDYIITHPVPGVSDDGEYKVNYVKPSKEYTDIISGSETT
ncbi:MAG: SGNH/GDSL hydrolase family protein, partial [Lachnospiraceae bacterium]|nr:SGNH/GDSL hydrolase family protein [Lachnospiraceae bacterium]